ncbi:hypothetical protein CPB84DRAFT_1679469 [Gymnopilus junonius]|uniref:Uncharacterized protein n=1 Tax=Gymnopilus junonius TaxID=109634 RepID=A0A9P5NP16_GYMJU|nr:hypothetical protein CPB84DRAFT_1679469 [Gymnopilus junonius]
MHPSLRCCSARVHTPLIKFLGKRSYPSTPDAPHPHPAAPAELKQRFSEFLAKMNASSSSESAAKASSGPAVYSEFWEAPPKFWNYKTRHIEEAEIEAIMTGGASSY